MSSLFMLNLFSPCADAGNLALYWYCQKICSYLLYSSNNKKIGYYKTHIGNIGICALLSYIRLWIVLTVLPANRSHASIVFTQCFKNRLFTLLGRQVAPINVKFGTGSRLLSRHGERTAPVPNFTFNGAEM